MSVNRRVLRADNAKQLLQNMKSLYDMKVSDKDAWRILLKDASKLARSTKLTPAQGAAASHIFHEAVVRSDLSSDHEWQRKVLSDVHQLATVASVYGSSEHLSSLFSSLGFASFWNRRTHLTSIQQQWSSELRFISESRTDAAGFMIILMQYAKSVNIGGRLPFSNFRFDMGIESLLPKTTLVPNESIFTYKSRIKAMPERYSNKPITKIAVAIQVWIPKPTTNDATIILQRVLELLEPNKHTCTTLTEAEDSIIKVIEPFGTLTNAVRNLYFNTNTIDDVRSSELKNTISEINQNNHENILNTKSNSTTNNVNILVSESLNAKTDNYNNLKTRIIDSDLNKSGTNLCDNNTDFVDKLEKKNKFLSTIEYESIKYTEKNKNDISQKGINQYVPFDERIVLKKTGPDPRELRAVGKRVFPPPVQLPSELDSFHPLKLASEYRKINEKNLRPFQDHRPWQLINRSDEKNSWEPLNVSKLNDVERKAIYPNVGTPQELLGPLRDLSKEYEIPGSVESLTDATWEFREPKTWANIRQLDNEKKTKTNTVNHSKDNLLYRNDRYTEILIQESDNLKQFETISSSLPHALPYNGATILHRSCEKQLIGLLKGAYNEELSELVTTLASTKNFSSPLLNNIIETALERSINILPLASIDGSLRYLVSVAKDCISTKNPKSNSTLDALLSMRSNHGRIVWVKSRVQSILKNKEIFNLRKIENLGSIMSENQTDIKNNESTPILSFNTATNALLRGKIHYRKNRLKSIYENHSMKFPNMIALTKIVVYKKIRKRTSKKVLCALKQDIKHPHLSTILQIPHTYASMIFNPVNFINSSFITKPKNKDLTWIPIYHRLQDTFNKIAISHAASLELEPLIKTRDALIWLPRRSKVIERIVEDQIKNVLEDFHESRFDELSQPYNTILRLHSQGLASDSVLKRLALYAEQNMNDPISRITRRPSPAEILAIEKKLTSIHSVFLERLVKGKVQSALEYIVSQLPSDVLHAYVIPLYPKATFRDARSILIEYIKTLYGGNSFSKEETPVKIKHSSSYKKSLPDINELKEIPGANNITPDRLNRVVAPEVIEALSRCGWKHKWFSELPTKIKEINKTQEITYMASPYFFQGWSRNIPNNFCEKITLQIPENLPINHQIIIPNSPTDIDIPLELEIAKGYKFYGASNPSTRFKHLPEWFNLA